MAKWMAALDSAHQIGLFTSLEGVLIVVGGSSSLDFKKQRNRSWFWLYLHNQGQYGNMDDGVGFSASNRFIYAPERRSNGSWRLFVSGREIGDVISDSLIASDRTGKWTAVFWLAASNKLKCSPGWQFEALGHWVKKTRKLTNLERFSMIPQQPAIVMENGLRHLIRRAK